MSNVGKPALGRRSFLGSRARRVLEWVALAAVVGAAAALVWFREDFPAWQLATAWSVLGLVTAFLLRRGWIRLFGPVLFYDLVRNARRTRTYVTRVGYLLLLLVFLWFVVGMQTERSSFGRGAQGGVDPKEMAALAEAFFATFMGVQFALAVFLTPAYVATAVTEEKERKTLEYLLATDLDNREIVLGKLAARVGYLTLLLLTGLPVLGAVQFLGGVAPELVLGGFAATAVTVASLAGLSILASVYVRRSRDAILFTYLGVLVYCGFCVLGSVLADVGYFPAVQLFPGCPTPADLLYAFQVGNPFYVLRAVFGTAATPQLTALAHYAVFHGVLALTTVALAVVRLRPIALRETGGAVAVQNSVWRRRRTRPLRERPMIWKELYHDMGMRLRKWGLVLIGLMCALSFAPLPFIFGMNFYHRDLGREVNQYVRVAGTVVACMVILGAAVRGSVAVRVERDKDTLDALLTSPLSTREILFAKWLGCLYGLRWPGVWLGVIYGIGLVTGGLSVFAVPLLAGTVLVYSATLSAVGLWFSAICRTTVRATVASVFTSLGLIGGHWLLWLCCVPLAGGGGGNGLEQIAKFQAGLTPPFVLGFVLPFAPADHGSWNPRPGPAPGDTIETEFLAYSLIGTISWAVLGGVVWAVLNDRFQTDSNRLEVLTPDGHPPKPLTWPPQAEAANS